MNWLKKLLAKFKRDKRGIVWVWAVVTMGIVTFAMAWFTLGWASMEVIDAVREQYDFPEEAENTIQMMINVIVWLPIIVIWGFILYGYVNSQRRDPRIYYE